MNEYGKQMAERERGIARDESGQSIVLIAMIIVGIVAFAGLAVDVGFLFARNSQFSAAVDAATLAGVVELHEADGLNKAISRSHQFLTTNGWPTDEITGTESLTDLGIPEFNLTATWQVDTFFMGVLGFDKIEISNSASAAYYARTDIPLTTPIDQGLIRTASQFVFGPDACTSLGDPVSPPEATDSLANPTYERTEGIYTYRIAVPHEYITDTGQSFVHVQLFDPDNYNDPSTDPTSGSTVYERVDGTTFTGDGSTNCNSGAGGPGEMCVVGTNDTNPFWFVRVDEIYNTGMCPSPNTGNYQGNTVTTYELYYRDGNQDRQEIATYVSNNPPDITYTDLSWITPGAEGGNAPTSSGDDFIVDLNNVPADANELHNIYLEVSTTAGTSKNVWDVWAGPPEMANGYSADVNQRNLEVLRTTITTTNRSQVYAQGYLPVNAYQASGDVTLPIGAIDPVLGGGAAYVSAFDMDTTAAGATAGGTLNFTLDTVAEGDFKVTAAINCDGGSCNFQWINPQAAMYIPTIEDGVAFYGGNLLVTYQPQQDDHTWSVAITRGRPFLTR